MPAVDAHVLPMQNYVAATSPLPPDLARSLIADDMAVSDSRFVVYYYRMSADHRLIFGGGELFQRFPRDIAGFVRRHLARVFPQLADVPLEFAWGGTLSITPNRLPYAREVAPGLFSLSGFSGLGVALGPWLGRAWPMPCAARRAWRGIACNACPRRAFPEARGCAARRWPPP
jgi:gamma-glutamylputrescine oxidase